MPEAGQATYLITGGTGSLGTALTHKLLSEGHKVRVYARNEHGHEKLEKSVKPEHKARFSSLIGDVRDVERLKRAMTGAWYVVHAAAQKIIPLAEYNPRDCIQTNVGGTANVIEACLDCGVEKAILISTDKARAPSTLYGASKLCAERLWLAANRYRGADHGIFAAVAYGNVWGSNGSVLHAFVEQAQYGALKLTDPECTRFNILMSEAVALVEKAIAEANPGELWIPKLPSYSLRDLAEAFRRAYKLEREVLVTGLRPGEKRHEDLISENESCTVSEETTERYVMTPGVNHQAGGWSYGSGKNKWRLSVAILEKLIRDTLGVEG